jgi:hypothetical protein
MIDTAIGASGIRYGSRREPTGRVQRASILLRYHAGETVSAIAGEPGTNRPRVERCVNKALELGVVQALGELPGRGRRPSIPPEARAWVIAPACLKPKDLGYAQELWTTRLLATHVREHCAATGHPSVAKLGRGTVSKMLTAQQVQPHKVQYYLERRDPEFDAKMVQVLHVYQEVAIWREQGIAPRIWSPSCRMTKSPAFKPSRIPLRIDRRCRGNIKRSDGTTNMSGTARCRCWPASTCCLARSSAWRGNGIAARSSSNS